MKKIVICSTTRSYGGAHVMAYDLFKSIIKQQTKISFLNLEDRRYGIVWFKANILLERFLSLIFRDKSTGFKSSALFGLPFPNQYNLEGIMHLHWTSCGLISLNQLINHSGPIIITLHDKWWFSGRNHINPSLRNSLDRLIFNRKRIVLKKAKKLIFPSNYLKARFLEMFPEYDYKCILIRNINSIEQKAQTETKEERKIVGINFSNPFHNKAKGSETLKEIFNYLEINPTKIEFIHVGPYQNKDVEYSKKFKTKIKFLGGIRKNEIKDFYSQIDILFHPSQYENLSTVIIEAISMGKPVFCFNVGGNSEISNVTFEKDIESDDIIKILKFFEFNQLDDVFKKEFSKVNIVKNHLNIYESINYNNN